VIEKPGQFSSRIQSRNWNIVLKTCASVLVLTPPYVNIRFAVMGYPQYGGASIGFTRIVRHNIFFLPVPVWWAKLVTSPYGHRSCLLSIY
jgi:hypothetical protein